ncbi:hypothetical protein ACFQX6_33460 [Streptosporangium lutulentum]
MAFSLSRDQTGTGSIALAIAPACIGGVLIGLQSANAFGIDGRSLWMNSVVYGTDRDWRTDLAGRHLAVAAIAVPLLALLSVVASFLAATSCGPFPRPSQPGASSASGSARAR